MLSNAKRAFASKTQLLSECGERIALYRLVLLRHGESIRNKENLFTGWTDVDLSERGVKEANEAGLLLKGQQWSFDIAFTSVLRRAIRTLWVVQDVMNLMWIPVQCDWRLNERHYGALQGLNKDQTAVKYGAAQVKLWRRSYDVRPPALNADDQRYPGKDPRYRDLTSGQLPVTESLKDTVVRVLPCCTNGSRLRSGRERRFWYVRTETRCAAW